MTPRSESIGDDPMKATAVPIWEALPDPAGLEDYDVVVDLETVPPDKPPRLNDSQSTNPASQGDDLWYVGRPTGQREGPVSLTVLKQRLAAGHLSAQYLVWRKGMSSWATAQTLPDLFDPQIVRAIPPPMPLNWTTRCTAMLESMTRILGQVSFCIMLGRICGILSILVFFLSLLLLYWKMSWFTGALLLGFMFLFGETTGVLLAAIQRIESRLLRQKDSTQEAAPCNSVEQDCSHESLIAGSPRLGTVTDVSISR